MASADQVYQYLAPSAVRLAGHETDVVLATSGGNVEGKSAAHPRFFDGFLEQPEQTARVAGSQPVRLHVGADEVGIKTFGSQIVEQKVPLPDRWVKGFAEVQVAAAGLVLLADLAMADARGFLRALPRSSRHVAWVKPTGRSLRLSSQPGSGAACLAGPERLWSLEPLLRFASRLRVYGRDSGGNAAPTASAWELTLDAARFTVVLSPEVSRGFSGEGGLLFELASSDAESDAEYVTEHLGWGYPVPIDRLAPTVGLSVDRTRTALMFLAAQGRVGFDLAQGAYFHRELPLRADALLKLNPRLMEARQLVEDGNVQLENGGARVRSGDLEHRITFATDHDRCTCPWWGKYSGARGPCKHVLAARLATGL